LLKTVDAVEAWLAVWAITALLTTRNNASEIEKNTSA
jgi:hypothetical protein